MREIETLQQTIAKLKSEARLAEGKLAAKFSREVDPQRVQDLVTHKDRLETTVRQTQYELDAARATWEIKQKLNVEQMEQLSTQFVRYRESQVEPQHKGV